MRLKALQNFSVKALGSFSAGDVFEVDKAIHGELVDKLKASGHLSGTTADLTRPTKASMLGGGPEGVTVGDKTAPLADYAAAAAAAKAPAAAAAPAKSGK